MTVGTWLREATAQLTAAGVLTARLDALVLLEDELSQDRSWLLAHDEAAITRSHCNRLQKILARRAAHEPLAYIRQQAEFYGRQFVVNANVLVPRPETETLIDLSKELIASKNCVHIADIGTGSGCVGLTLALECAGLVVDAYDTDATTLAVARQNAKRLHATIKVFRSDLLTGLQPSRTYELIVANLPYVPKNYPTNAAATHEPAIALFSGADGLDHYRRFWHELATLPFQPSFVVTEAFPFQHASLVRLAAKAGYQLAKTDGFGQSFELS